MKLSTYEFEVTLDDGWYIAEPYDLDGGTQAETFEELCENTADWLRTMVEHYAMRGIELPAPTFGNEPRHGGSNIVVAVQAGLETVDRVTAAEAARMLGVSPGRVSQMLASGKLDGWREGHSSYVTRASVEARMASRPAAGRPKMAAAC